MASPPVALAPIESAAPMSARGERDFRHWLLGPALVLPAVVCAVLFALVPLVYLVIVSLTLKSDFFFDNAVYTLENYRVIWDRYMPHVYTTVRLAVLSSLIDLVFGYPFAYILIRKVRYRELVRVMMTFPLFGPLYLAFGLYYMLLPTGPLGPVLEFLDVPATKLLFSLPAVLLAMAVFTFPFMVMNIGAALSNVDPTLEEAARTLGAKPWQIFARVVFPLSKSGILAGFLMCFGWNIGVFVPSILLGRIPEQRILSLTLQTKGLSQADFGMASAMGVVLMVIAFVVTWVSLKFSRGALGA
jgi:ABC-type spermidine/putrescine transport system permease subunit I